MFVIHIYFIVPILTHVSKSEIKTSKNIAESGKKSMTKKDARLTKRNE